MSEIDEKKVEFEAMKAEAKELKIWEKIRGSKLPEMKKAIEEARSRPAVETPKEAEGAVAEVVEEPKAVKVKRNFNSVTIYNGKQEIRTYSLAIHGESFADLATSFATERGYTMELIDTGKNITCPHCGQSFAPKK